ncbi:MAG: PLP-dependent aminotransferase family protein [Candidatus Promineifilaceae bacterium]|nr:PLP-dependent aminotransferase family protein [Candidatus Promineifilaceae bacterium]
MTTPWKHRYALRMQGMGSSVIRELLKLTQDPEIISFAGGLPAPEIFPVSAFDKASSKVLRKYGSQALQYSMTEGYMPLRQWIVDYMARYGIEANVDNVLITSGSQQALDLIGKVLINPGDLILTEKPTYLGALQAWRAYQADYTCVPIDHDGLRVDLLEEALCGGPKFMYILPNFQNPGGVTLSLARRMKLIEFADRYGVPIIEDDPYGELRFEGEHIPPLVVLDAQKQNGAANGTKDHGFMHGNVIYTSTFSKTLAPGLRLAWIVAPSEVIGRCVMAKQGMDLHTSTFIQMTAFEVLQGDFLEDHVRLIRRVYGERRDIMLEALEQYFPSAAQWTRPDGGLFLWVTLPEEIDTFKLMPKAIENRVAFVPGAAFYPDGSGQNTFRLNFSNAQPEHIRIGIARLAEVITSEITSCHEPVAAFA